MSQHTLFIINGPGLSDVASFADQHANITSLEHIREDCLSLCRTLKLGCDFRQSDDQDTVIDWVRHDAPGFDALIINQLGCIERTPVDYPRYVADLAALATLDIPVTEIHMTNVLRHDAGQFASLSGPAGKTGLICGLGVASYRVAIRAAAARLLAGART